MQSLDQSGRVDLLAIRLNKSLLDDKRIMKYFILLNNCSGPPDIQAAVNSEFDFPSMAAFYKAQATQIVSGVSNSITVDVGPFVLGEYDSGRKAFPFIEAAGTKRKPVVAEGVGIPHRNISPPCGDSPGDRWYGPMHGILTERVSFKRMSFDDFPLDEISARNYVSYVSSIHAPQRIVFLRVDIDILENPARITDYGRGVDFDGKVTKITVFATRDNQHPTSAIGILFP
ncbi:MAG: hypothetical protein WA655_23565 [Candidatus Korobacteraceae bacterium]